jgi:hypothetical protein
MGEEDSLSTRCVAAVLVALRAFSQVSATYHSAVAALVSIIRASGVQPSDADASEVVKLVNVSLENDSSSAALQVRVCPV